ncbi:metal ABC transporter solute-binding protein, Zn/Mn family [Salidesulfovibrio onnuriiensis]|uniref:metal ABC transporter solute-binding protein, Zn/Mn family n=1 Tax=Salidesulfovibrio onnuriiensis TaxID=2583823 RepID=UPI0011CC1A02|nr:zinc ABC transporter substrate-binding protein [Salidesulfovibrio onnuriiensis]
MIRLLITALLAIALTAAPAAAKVTAVVGIMPVKYFVEQIGGQDVEVTALVEAGADPHTYEPKPSQMRTIAKADALFAIGIGLEKNWIPRFKSANPNLRVFPLDNGVSKVPMQAHAHDEAEVHHEGHGHQGLDPHIWTSPLLVKQVAGNILAGLVEIDPGNEAAYRRNHNAFVGRVDALHQEIQKTLAGVPEHAEFMVYHPAWGYFARTYHLVQIPVESEGKAPGPRQLGELIEHAREHHIKVIFVQPQLSERSARTIAEAIDGQVVKADPLAYDWPENLLRVAETFRKALVK